MLAEETHRIVETVPDNDMVNLGKSVEFLELTETRRVGWLWRTVLVRRSQRAQMRWARLYPLLTRWIPQPRILHPYPDARFAATHPA